MFSFDASTVQPQESFSPLPAGTYNARAVKAEIRPLKSGNGAALALQLEVMDGPHAKRVLFCNLNVQHSNPEAQRIAQQQLSALCHAVGALKINEQSLHQLCNKPVRIRVKVRPAQNGYDASNDVTGFEAMPGMAMMPSMPGMPAANAAQHAQQPAAAAVPPWAVAAA